MPDFPRVDHAVFTPTQCLTCATSHCDLGFIDTAVDLPVYGHVYFCGRCVLQAGSRIGMLEPRVADEIRGEARAAREANAELLVDLARAEGRGTWTFTPADEQKLNRALAEQTLEFGHDPNDALEATTCPDCGQPKGAGSKRCRSCSARAAVAAKKAGASA